MGGGVRILIAKGRVWQVLSWCLVLAMMIAIFCFSGQEGQLSSGLTAKITAKVLRLLTGTDARADNWALFERTHFIVRKIGHASGYFMLCLLCLFALYGFRMPFWAKCLLAFVICCVFAGTDEWHQTFVSGRSGQLRDVLIDSGGALLAVLCCALAAYLIKARKKEG
jgi:VanZ family protein